MADIVRLTTITRHSPPNEMDQLPFNTECLVTYLDGREEIYVQKSEDDRKPSWVMKTTILE
jgi:hypothetical protein